MQYSPLNWILEQKKDVSGKTSEIKILLNNIVLILINKN